ncbi:class I SAM-dependent methyltransferase [Streptomyces sp. NPDC001828]|uniref:class I SAM-dependent methyltransferase n=1 Tax=Streptomyces sp. NPDC001828 TaxID=3364615 RepID=UPI0036ACF1A7
MYRHTADPWHLAERWYERRKYDLTVAALPQEHYRRAFEPACSVGELTRRLATRCDTVLACDRVADAVSTAQQRTREFRQVTVQQMTIPAQWPEGTFDLIVLSELLYYLDAATLDSVLEHTVTALEPGGTLATVHWNHPVDEHLSTGSGIAETLSRLPGMHLLADHRENDFVLQIHQRLRPDGSRPPTPAEREGLA